MGITLQRKIIDTFKLFWIAAIFNAILWSVYVFRVLNAPETGAESKLGAAVIAFFALLIAFTPLFLGVVMLVVRVLISKLINYNLTKSRIFIFLTKACVVIILFAILLNLISLAIPLFYH